MVEKREWEWGVIGALCLSVTSSVSIVIVNKALMTILGFHFATTLTSWHLVVTYITLYASLKMKLFENNKALDLKTVILFGFLNGVSVAFLNLSLAFNSVGFYQMTKLAIIPFTLLIETIFLKKEYSIEIKASLLVLLSGVGIASITDLQLNLLGTIISLLAIITTCIAQILTNTIQKAQKVSSTQLLYQSAPFQAAILLVSGPLVDRLFTKQDVFAFYYAPIVLGTIAVSCMIAVSVNLSTFMVIGKTSAVTYQVLGHLKTCLVLGFGFFIFKNQNPFTSRNIIGIFIALLGMALYSYFSITPQTQTQTQTLDLSSTPFQEKEKETTSLLEEKTAINEDDDDIKKLSNDALV